ncbi:hypothetical protein [Candidatus Laterigemmans baculatus]|uniref:hypothetical protein n=1 Tax=Candidatus Laterigemmans baculatus TaxID=2770505 RepID=UPI0013DB2DAE|nr:hypothetical protein [Candidatus Laterigemmans baculatus]
MPILALTSAARRAAPAASPGGTGALAPRWRSGLREAVGIDVTTASLHVAHVAARRDGLYWTSRGSVDHPLPLDAERMDSEGRGGENRAPTSESVGRAVARSLPRPSDGRRRVAAAVLPASVAVLRTPSEASAEAFGSSLRADLGASLAAGSSIQSCRWQVGRSSRQMLYAVSGSASAAVGEAIEQAGYSCRRIDSRPHALARSLNLDATGGARVMIEWGWNDCVLVIADNASGGPFFEPSLCRSLRGYGLSSAARLAGRGGADASPRSSSDPRGDGPRSANRRAAERRGVERREASVDPELLRPLVQAAASELLRSFRLAESLPGVDPSGPVVICGAAAAAAELPDLLAAALGRPVRRWQWGGRGRPADHEYAPPDGLFAVSLGLACGELAAHDRRTSSASARGRRDAARGQHAEKRGGVEE